MKKIQILIKSVSEYINKFKPYSPVLLRIGIALVFLWFGINQMIDVKSWVDFVPESVVKMSGLNVTTLVYLNGIFEIVFGVAMLFGYYTRLAALALAIHMFEITYVVGYDSIGVRDFGLSIATFVVFMNGADIFSLDKYMAGEDSSITS